RHPPLGGRAVSAFTGSHSMPHRRLDCAGGRTPRHPPDGGRARAGLGGVSLDVSSSAVVAVSATVVELVGVSARAGGTGSPVCPPSSAASLGGPPGALAGRGGRERERARGSTWPRGPNR